MQSVNEGTCYSVLSQRSAFLEQSKDQTMSQNVTLPATISAGQSLAVEALASNESEQWSVVSGQWMEADRVTGPR
jgi:hypothetical protein